jgi:hypothetical protein
MFMRLIGETSKAPPLLSLHPIEINRANPDERAIIHARDPTGFFRV